MGGIDLYDYNELVYKIKKLDPKAEVPPASAGIGAYQVANDLYRKLSGPKYVPPGPKDIARNNANKLQTEISVKLGDFVRRGLVETKDYPFPPEDMHSTEARMKWLKNMGTRLQQAWEEANWTPEHRAKVALHELQAFKAEMLVFKAEVNSRLAAIEQELSRV
jgi:hypothetical protein